MLARPGLIFNIRNDIYLPVWGKLNLRQLERAICLPRAPAIRPTKGNVGSHTWKSTEFYLNGLLLSSLGTKWFERHRVLIYQDLILLVRNFDYGAVTAI